MDLARARAAAAAALVAEEAEVAGLELASDGQVEEAIKIITAISIEETYLRALDSFSVYMDLVQASSFGDSLLVQY